MQCLTDHAGCIPVSMPLTPVDQKAFVGSIDLTSWFQMVIPPKQEGGIFGFAEFVQAFALLVLIYTLSDVRYRFRVETAPIRLFGATFWIAGFIGVGTLVCDVWFTQQYPVPQLLANRTLWQAAFGFLFLALVMMWLWFAFLKPPVFSKWNSPNYARALYRYLLQGAESDLPVIADELARSAKSIVEHAGRLSLQANGVRERNHSAGAIANDLLLLIGNRKFCRHIVASAPSTAIAFFDAMSHLKKYRLPVGQFASNISIEALINKDSILYHEDEGYYSGFFGYVRPFTNAIYGDFQLVESLAEGNSPLDVDLDLRLALDASQLRAYVRATLVTFESAQKSGHWSQHSYALFRAFSIIERSCADLYKLGSVSSQAHSSDINRRLNVVVDFVDRAIEILDKHGVKTTTLRRRYVRHKWHEDYYDHLAKLMFEVVYYASLVEGVGHENWMIQYGAVWSRFFSLRHSKTRSIVLFKLRRLLYDEIVSLGKVPNFRSAPILGLCLNVMGLSVGAKRDHTRGEYQLRKAVLSWARRKYLWLVREQHKVAAACLVGTISFDVEHKRLVKTYIEGLHLEPPRDYLDLMEPADGTEVK